MEAEAGETAVAADARAENASNVKRMYRTLVISAAVASLAFFPSAVAQAATAPNFIIRAVAEVTTYTQEPFDDNTSIKQGSGVFIDHGGCLYTNSHVVINAETGEVDPHIGIAIATDRGRAPEFAFEGEAVFVDQSLDLAYVCPKEPNGVFTEYFERFSEPHFDSRAFGEDVWVLGYPASGEGTITVSPGNIVGFIENPDVSQWLGIVRLDTEQLKLYKTDALAGPGVSGGVMIDQEYRLVGVPFAGSIIAGAFTFVLSEDVYLEFERRVQAHLFAQGLVPLDCVYDGDSGYFVQSSQRFYDNQCTLAYDEAMEHEVKLMHKAFCAVDISPKRLVSAVRRSKELGDLSKWSDSILARCGGEEQAANARAAKSKFAQSVRIKKRVPLTKIDMSDGTRL